MENSSFSVLSKDRRNPLVSISRFSYTLHLQIFLDKDTFLGLWMKKQFQENPIVIDIQVLLDLLLDKTMNHMKRACDSATCPTTFKRKMTRLGSVVTRFI